MERNTTKTPVFCEGIRIAVEEDGKEVAHAYVYTLRNSIHGRPFGFLEDIFVVPEKRGEGIGKKLVEEAIQTAQELGCYKFIATSHHERASVHALYERLGFTRWGLEFRMDFTTAS